MILEVLAVPARLSRPTRRSAVGHAPLFVLTVVAFYLGLDLGLAFSPALVTLLWVVAADLDVAR